MTDSGQARLDGIVVDHHRVPPRHLGCRQPNRLADAVVGAAPAGIGHFGVDVRIGRIRVSLEQRHRAHDLPRLTIAALRHVELDPGELHGMRPVRRQALDGGDRLAGCGRDRNAARANRTIVDVQGAGPALRNATAELGAGEPEMIADHPEQRRFRRHVDGMPDSIYREVYCHSVPRQPAVLQSAFASSLAEPAGRLYAAGRGLQEAYCRDAKSYRRGRAMARRWRIARKSFVF